MELTPAMRQYMDIKREHKDAILFFRMGDFYEMFFEDAIVASRALDIALTSRDKAQAIPMCGIPYHAKDNYIARLLKEGNNIAVCEQFSQEGKGGIFQRKVVEVLTPGLIPREGLLEPGRGNFLVSLCLGEEYSLSAADISTGELFFERVQRADTIADALQKIDGGEIIYDGDTAQKLKYSGFARKIGGRGVKREVSFFDRKGTKEIFKKRYETSFPEDEGFLLLLDYIRRNQPRALENLSDPRPFHEKKGLYLDESAIRSLEVLRNLAGGRKGSLVSVLDTTKTSMGKRLIRRWLAFPLSDREKIQKRLDATEELYLSKDSREKAQDLLEGISDLERVGIKVLSKSAGPRDMVALKNGIERGLEVKKLLLSMGSKELILKGESLKNLTDLEERISRTLTDTPPIFTRDGGVIRGGFHRGVDELREIKSGGKTFLKDLERRERERSGISTLKIKYNRVFGYFIEVSRSQVDRVPVDYIRKQTLVNAERFITEELKEFENRQLRAKEELLALEENLYVDFLEECAPFGKDILHNSRIIAALDVLLSFAQAAEEKGYVKPLVQEERTIKITGGRHPVVEQVVGKREFVVNDALLDPDENQIMVVTGPNMSGKSTYIRQLALIVLMAHAGSFVPAEECEIALTDSIFTRIGASDNIHLGESTFMVEMKEVSRILREVTDRSLVVLDEVGRGTSTYDGLSIAWAVIEYIQSLEEKRPLTLFATHYHEICELERLLPRIKNYNVKVKEWNGEVLFIRKVDRGPSNKSYGIYVGEIAGLPPQVTSRAKEILKYLENTKYNDSKIKGLTGEGDGRALQLTLFRGAEDLEKLISELDGVNPEKITPLEAINFLSSLKGKLEKLKKKR